MNIPLDEAIEVEHVVDVGIRKEGRRPSNRLLEPALDQEITLVNSILLSDDSRSIRQILTTTLRSSGYEVIDVENGQDAARVARDRDFDLILTDLNMPLLDGIGLTRELRTMPRHSQTPIIIVTTESQLAKKEKAKEAGANGWIVKPIQPPRLVQVVEQILAKTAGVR